jgi:hypothetical protein
MSAISETNLNSGVGTLQNVGELDEFYKNDYDPFEFLFNGDFEIYDDGEGIEERDDEEENKVQGEENGKPNKQIKMTRQLPQRKCKRTLPQKGNYTGTPVDVKATEWFYQVFSFERKEHKRNTKRLLA